MRVYTSGFSGLASALVLSTLLVTACQGQMTGGGDFGEGGDDQGGVGGDSSRGSGGAGRHTATPGISWRVIPLCIRAQPQ